MIIKLSRNFAYELKRTIRNKFFENKLFCEKFGIKPQVLSRQLNSQSIEYEFLIKYLKALDYLPASYNGFKVFDENFFIATLPVRYRDHITARFLKEK